MSTALSQQDWSKRIFDKLAGAGVTLFSYVPDFGNSVLVEMADEDNRTRTVLLSS